MHRVRRKKLAAIRGTASAAPDFRTIFVRGKTEPKAWCDTRRHLEKNRTEINEIGIEPDETVELPESVENVLHVDRSEDTQLQKAIDMLTE